MSISKAIQSCLSQLSESPDNINVSHKWNENLMNNHIVHFTIKLNLTVKHEKSQLWGQQVEEDQSFVSHDKLRMFFKSSTLPK